MPSRPRKMRVLIVDAIPTTREHLAKLLFFVPLVEVVGLAASAPEAIAQASDLQPDIILVDLTISNMDSMEAVETIVDRLPQARIILVSTAGATHYLASPLGAAVRALLIKPITTEGLTKAIRHAGQA